MRRTSTWLAIVASLALLAAACGGAPTGGPAEGEPVTVAAIFDLTGATSDVGVPYSEGMRGYVDWINGEGGVEGRQIDLIWQDYQYDVAQAEQLYSQFVSEGAAAFQGWGTGDTEALRTRITEDEIPFMSASYSEALIDPAETPYNFVVAASYSQQMRIALRWIADNHDGHAEVAVFHHDSPFGLSPVADGEAYIGDNGLDIGYDSYPMSGGATDYVGELTQAQGQGVTHIVVQNVSSPAATLARDIASQGLDVVMICLNWCGDEIFIELAGDAAEGVVTVQPFTPPSVPQPGHDQPASFLEGDLNLHHFQGWYTMAVMTEAIGNVITDGNEVTGPNIREALEAMGPYDTGGVSSPVDFTPESHAGMDGSPLFVVEGGEWTELSGVMTP